MFNRRKLFGFIPLIGAIPFIKPTKQQNLPVIRFKQKTPSIDIENLDEIFAGVEWITSIEEGWAGHNRIKQVRITPAWLDEPLEIEVQGYHYEKIVIQGDVKVWHLHYPGLHNGEPINHLAIYNTPNSQITKEFIVARGRF